MTFDIYLDKTLIDQVKSLMDVTLNAIAACNNTVPSIYTYCLTEYKITFSDP